MLKVSTAAAIISVLLLACSKKEEGNEEASTEVGSTPKVESAQQPDTETMQSGGEIIEVPEVLEVPEESQPEPESPLTLNAPGSKDLRPDAPSTASFPTLRAIDPRTHTPSGTYTPDGGKLNRNIFSGQIAVPSDGRSHVLPECEHPFAAPGNSPTTGLTIDGNLSEWPVASVIAVDKSGDGGNSPADLREVYFAKDGSSAFFGAKVQGTVSNVGTSAQRLLFIFSSLAVPADNTTYPEATTRLILEAWGPVLKFYNGTSYVTYPGSGTVYNLAVSGSSVELRIDLSVIEGLMSGGPYVVDVSGYGVTGAGAWVMDRTGNHFVGLVDDYACIVDMPNADRTITTSKMFVMRRSASTVSAGVAETSYRSMIHGSRASEYVAKDHMAYWDTVAFTVIKAMSPAGLNTSNAGIYVEDDITNRFGNTGDLTYLTFVSAHEYLHSYNATSYRLSESWMVEGHSNWLATRAMGSYFGDEVGASWFNIDLGSFLAEEKTYGVQTIDDDTWGDAPYSGLFYYRKAASYIELLQTKIDYDSFLNSILKLGILGTPLPNRDTFLAAYKGLPNYQGAAGDNLTDGWWGGDYSTSNLPISLLADTDADGLLNFQETATGTNAASADSDSDNTSDQFEKVNGLNPSVKQNVTYLAQDNLLTDWVSLAPTWLRTALQSSSSNPACGNFTRLNRYGVVIKEGWVYISAELKQTPTANENLKIVAFVNGGPEQFVMQHGQSIIWHANPSTRAAETVVPFSGTTVEIAYNTAWLGWNNGDTPPGTTFNVATFTGSTQCDLGATVTP